MKRILPVILLIIIWDHNTHAQVGKICNWDGDKKAAVVLTFDDWTPGQYPVATPALKTRSIVGTFFIITNNVASWEYPWPDVQTEVNNGNEVGNHTLSHPALNTLNSWPGGKPSNINTYSTLNDQLAAEIGGAKKTFEQNITNQKILTFAYPFGDYNAQVLDSVISTGHICARGVTPPTNFTYNFISSPSDYYNLNCYPMSNSVTLPQFFGQIQNVINGGGLLTFLYHSLDSPTLADTWFSQVEVPAFESQMDTLVSVRKQIWITTLVQAIKYHKEKNSATLSSVQASNGSSWILNLTDTLSNDSIYNQPLTLKLKMNGVNYTAVQQNGRTLQIDSIYSDTIMFRAIPNRGNITLYTAAALAGISLNANVSPNNFSNIVSTNLSFTVTTPLAEAVKNVTLDLSSLGGNNSTLMTSVSGSNFSASFNVPAGFAIGSKYVLVTVTDVSNNTRTTTIPLTISSGITISSLSVLPSTIVNNVPNSVSFSVNATDDGSVAGVTANLSSIGGGSAVALTALGGNNYSLNYNAPSGVTPGTKSIPVTVTDNQGNTSTQNVTLVVNSTICYSPIYTDASTLFCSGCVYASKGDLNQEVTNGAFEGNNDYLFTYTVSGYYAGFGFSFNNWGAGSALDFSGYDSLQLAFKGPFLAGTGIFVTLQDTKNSNPTQVILPAQNNYSLVTLALSSFTGTDLTKISQLNFGITGVKSGIGNMRIDDIQLIKNCTSVLTNIPNEKLNVNQSSISIFPNPTNGDFTILSNVSGNYSIFSDLGAIVEQVELNQSNNFSRKIENLNSGIYLIVGTTGENKVAQKVIVAK